MEEDSREDEFNTRIRRSLSDWFGPFEEFHERVAKNKQGSRHGLIRSKMKPRPPPIVTLQVPLPYESPSHVNVHVALQSMKNLVDEPLSALPLEFADLKKSVKIENNKKRKNEEEVENQIDVKRKKEAPTTTRNSIPPSTPDSGVHSTESDQLEEPSSDEVVAMLNIMKTLDEPKLSPIPEHFIKEFQKELKMEQHKNEIKIEPKQPIPVQKTRKFLSESSMSSASTSREQTPEEEEKGCLKLKGLKPERIQKLLDLAKSRGKLTDIVEEKKPLERIPEKVVIEKPVEKERPVEKYNKNADRSSKRPNESFGKAEKLEKTERLDRSEKPERPEKSEKPQKNRDAKEKKIPAIEEPKASTSFAPLPPPPRPPQLVRDSTPKPPTPKPATPKPASTPSSQTSESSSRSFSSQQKPPNKAVQNVLNQNNPRLPSPSSGPPSRRSVTPTVSSRPSSSLSIHEPSLPPPPPPPQIHVAPSEVPTTSTSTVTPTKSTRWACQWDHKKMTSIQRVPIPDPTTSNKTKAEFYHGLAREWKSQADGSKDRVIRSLNYMLSGVYFVLEAISKTEKDRNSAHSIHHCTSIYRDTYGLLGQAVFCNFRETSDVLAAHMLPRIKILSQIMLSVMQYQMYLYRADQAMRNFTRLESREASDALEIRSASRSSELSTHSSQHLAVPPYKGGPHGSTPKTIPSAGSTPSGPTGVTPWAVSLQTCPNTVTMPQVMFDAYKLQVKTTSALILASRYWEESKTLVRAVDASFIKEIETMCGKTIGMDMQFDTLAQFVLTAVASLRAEYEEERKQPLKPSMQKVKPVMDCALRTGSFYAEQRDQQQQQRRQPSQTTPQSSNQPSSSDPSRSRPPKN